MNTRSMASHAVAATLIAMTSAAVYAGIEVALFDIAVRGVETKRASPPPAERTQWIAEAPLEVANASYNLDKWNGMPGLQSAIRSIEVGTAGSEGDPASLIALTKLLSVKPTDGVGWADYGLSTYRLGFGQERLQRAFDMSTVMERRERSTALERGLLAIEAWSVLTADKQAQAIDQLEEVRNSFTTMEFNRLKNAVAKIAPQDKASLRATIIVRLGQYSYFLKQLGFS